MLMFLCYRLSIHVSIVTIPKILVVVGADLDDCKAEFLEVF